MGNPSLDRQQEFFKNHLGILIIEAAGAHCMASGRSTAKLLNPLRKMLNFVADQVMDHFILPSHLDEALLKGEWRMS